MLLNKNTFASLSRLQRLSITVRTFTPEKSFYFFLSLITAIILFAAAFNIYLRDNHTYISPRYNDTLRILSNEKVQTYTPLFASSRADTIVSNLLFSGLLRLTADGTYDYDLAENIVISDDGLTINVTLKKDLNFSNGEPITTDDVIYTYNKLQDYTIDNPDRPRYEGLDFEKLDNRTFNIRLKKSYSQLNKALTLGIISKSQYQGEDIHNLATSDSNLLPISSGQYKVTNYTLINNSIVRLDLENNNNYPILSHYKTIQLYFEDIPSTELNSYIVSNDIDFVMGYNQNIELVDDYEVISYDTKITSTIYLNPNKNESLINKSNREFLYKSIDRNYIINNILTSGATTTYDVLPASKNNYSPSLADYSSTTYSKSSTTILTISYLNSDINKKIYEYLKGVYQNYNIDLVANALDQEQLSSSIKNREYEMLISSTDIEDVSTLYSFLHSSQRNAPGLNITNYISKDFDANTETLRHATNTLIIDNAIESMRREFYNEFPYIPLYSRSNRVIKKKSIFLTINASQQREAYLLNNISSSYKSTEHLYNTISKYKEIIIKVNKIIHR